MHCLGCLFLSIDSLLILVSDVDLLVGTLLVDLLNVLLSDLHDNFPDVFEVSVLRSLLDLVSDEWILLEDVIQQELFAESDGLHVFNGHVDELRLLVEADIVVTDALILAFFDLQVVVLGR